MSDIIKLLPDHIANQIAAGEVIQRPASVIKELVENAIDAKATSIDVVIKQAGRTLIQVIDNGSGMSEMDARMAFERHATSKVQTANDLFALHTKGFRGEALASIAAIAHVELQTRQEQNDLGTHILIEGSKLVEHNKVTCKVGSSFAIKNLFFNVPARRNFLKSDAVEFNHIEEEFIRIVLAHPELNFSLYHNDTLCYKLSQGNHRKRIVDVFGKAINDKLIPINETTGIVTITGFVGKPEAAKKSRGEQYFFVNNRFFKDFYFNHAVTMAFENLLAPKTYVSYFLFFEVDPAVIDVNVHPTKTEIKFEEDKEIYAILKSTVKQGLGKYNISPSLDFELETSFDIPYDTYNKPVVEPKITVNPNYNPFSTSSSKTSGNGVKSGMSDAIRNSGFNNQEFSKEDWSNFYNVEEVSDQEPEKLDLDYNASEEKHTDILIKGNYIINTTKSGLMFIHAKRAQERIMYDEIMQTFIFQALNSQQLLFPVSYTCSTSMRLLWQENKNTLERMGFLWDTNEEGLEIHGAPNELGLDSIEDAVQTISDSLSLNTLDKGEIAHTVASGIAIASSRKKMNLHKEAAIHLLDKLFSCKEHQYSPSGKLIIDTQSIDELTNKF